MLKHFDTHFKQMEIRKLNIDVIKKLRSSASMHSFTQCVTELVLNSIDSKSTAISVRIDLIAMKIQVVDNGEGISKDNMKVVGQRYFTSKCNNWAQLEKHVPYYGFRGEALADIAECAQSVSIISKFKNTCETYIKVISRKVNDKIEATKDRPSTGTTVTVEGFFYNLPVRRKRIVVEFELKDIKKNMESLIIINPNISFSVRNNITLELILQSKCSVDIVASLRYLHPGIDGEFNLLKIRKGKIQVEGLFLTELSPNKNFAYIYLNKRPIFSSKVEKFVQYLLSSTNNKATNTNFNAQYKYPVFVLNIKCPYSRVDILLSPSKTLVEFKDWEIIKMCIEKLVNSHFGKKQKPTINRVQSTVQFHCKSQGGFSETVGAIKGYAYRQNEIMTIAKEAIVNDTGVASNSNGMKLLQTNNFYNHASNQGLVQNNGRINNKTEHYSITDSTPSIQVRKNVRKILPVKISTKKLQKRNGKLNLKNEEYNISAVTHFTSDEQKGKDLIMGMFLKSTQAYNSEENIIDTGSEEIVYEEESHFLMQNNLHTNINGKKRKLSVSVNVRSKQKIRKFKRTKGIQTSFDNNSTNKCKQTNLKNRAFTNYRTMDNYIGTEYNGQNYAMKIVNSTCNKKNILMFENIQKTCCCDCHALGCKTVPSSTIKNNKIETNHTNRIAKCIATQNGMDICEKTKSPYFPLNQKTSNFHEKIWLHKNQFSMVETKFPYQNTVIRKPPDSIGNIEMNQCNVFFHNMNYTETYNNFEPIIFTTQNPNNPIQILPNVLENQQPSHMFINDLDGLSYKNRECHLYQKQLSENMYNLSSNYDFDIKLNSHMKDQYVNSFEYTVSEPILNITLTGEVRNINQKTKDIFATFTNQISRNPEKNDIITTNGIKTNVNSLKHETLDVRCQKYQKLDGQVDVSNHYTKSLHNNANLMPMHTLRTETLKSRDETEQVFSLNTPERQNLIENNIETEKEKDDYENQINGHIWIEKCNDIGNNFYINRNTGMKSMLRN